MFRSTIIILLFLVSLSISGCKTMDKFAARDSDEIDLSEVMPSLTLEEKYYLESWDQAASLADDAGDIQTSVFYYKKIAENFPQTKKGRYALKRLEKLDKGYNDQAQALEKEKIKIKSR